MDYLEIGKTIFVSVGRFLIQYGFYIYPALLILPPIAYILIARPGISIGKCCVYFFGLVMFACACVLMGGFADLAYFIVWLFLTPALLLADGVVWLISAFRKKSLILAAVMTALTVAISGCLWGNWVSLFGAVIFLFVLMLFRRDFR